MTTPTSTFREFCTAIDNIPTGGITEESTWSISGNNVPQRMLHHFPFHEITSTSSSYVGYGLLTTQLDIQPTDITEMGLKMKFHEVYASSTSGFPIITCGPQMDTGNNRYLAVGYDFTHKYFVINYRDQSGTWQKANSSQYIWYADTWLYIKLSFNGSEASLKVSTSGVEDTWETLATLDCGTNENGMRFLGQMCFGPCGSNQTINQVASGTLRMTYCYVCINNPDEPEWGLRMLSDD